MGAVHQHKNSRELFVFNPKIKDNDPRNKKQLDAHVKAIAKILYKNTPPSKIETFEGIETAVRDQVLEHVSPKIAFFYRRKDGNDQRAQPNHKKLCR